MRFLRPPFLTSLLPLSDRVSCCRYQVPEENLSPKTYFTKRLWKLDLPVRAEGWLELVVRAWDNALNTQPSEIRDAWNWVRSFIVLFSLFHS